jgi:hypothetical protein
MSKTCLTGLILMALTGCSTTEPLVFAPPKEIFVSPPDALLADCPTLYSGPEHNLRQTLAAKDRAEYARNVCNNDKRALRRWKSENVPATQ